MFRSQFALLKILVPLAAMGLSGCSSGEHTNTSGVGPATVLSHQASQCPAIAGEFLKDKGALQKTLKMDAIENGIQVTEDDKVWLVDGKNHSPANLLEVSYLGACDAQKVIVDVTSSGVYLGRIEYSLYSPTQVLIKTTAEDSRLGKTGSEVWELKPKP